jgi:hypothetical protein
MAILDVLVKLRRSIVVQVLAKHGGQARPCGLRKRRKAQPFAMDATR